MHANLQDKTWYGDGVPSGVMDNPVPRGGIYVNLGSGFAYVNNGTLESPNYVPVGSGGGGGDVPDPLELGAAVFADYVAVGLGIWEARGLGGDTSLDLSSEDNGHTGIIVSGLGAEITIQAGDAGASPANTGGELALLSGAGGAGGNGGEIHIKTGNGGTGGGGSGQLTIETGSALSEDGDGGALLIRTGGLGADHDGGNITIQAGTGSHGAGGNVEIQAGGTVDGDYGRLTLYEGAFNYGIEIQPTGLVFVQASPPMVPAIATAQSIVDALVTLGLIGQSA